MNNKIYCPSCFKPSIYESTAPNVCGFCGKSYLESSESIANINNSGNSNVTPKPKVIPLSPEAVKASQSSQEYVKDDDGVNYPEDDDMIDSPPQRPVRRTRPSKKLEYEIQHNPRANTQDIAQLVATGGSGARRDLSGIKVPKKLSEKQVSKILQNTLSENTRKQQK